MCFARHAAADARRVSSLVAIGFAVVLLGCDEPPPPQEQVIRPVRTLVVEEPETERVRTFSGTSKAGSEARLSFKVSGTLRTIAVQVGDAVEEGDLIAELDPGDFELQVEEAKAGVAQARAQARSARAAYKRARRLYETSGASKADLDAARAQAESAQAQISALSKRVQSAESNVAKTRLTAPAPGVIAQVAVEPNENVQPTQVVVILAGEGAPEVVVSVPAAYIRKVESGATVPVEFPELDGRTYDGVVTEVGEQAQDVAGTYPVTIRLDGAGAEVRSGLAARAEFTFGPGNVAPAFVVPSAAVAEDRAGRFVYLVVGGADDVLFTVKRQPVVVGELTSAGFRILSGLAAGDRVVTAGVSRIRDGQTVRLLASDRAAGQTGAGPAEPGRDPGTASAPAAESAPGTGSEPEAGRATGDGGPAGTRGAP